ncbi:methyltransferase domain-containing protein [Sulfurimonas lithotrophica]|uniref:Methyltransferase domain-containing protein n=1 Tax=Sulfurimonas lithotrophica TaxID=2590022 RepID=A0A5P8NZ54_9BACT|nr:methyltransferase domain-containing protein [Sulfurimonas lithotrophica]QFR48617.1 methyltransferase domain-containing protein [Sulfurimonas lithotrophica]
MSLKDKAKWDKKYLDTPKLLQKRKPSQKLVKFSNYFNGTQALDFASGNGRNSIYLASLGFNVDAYDISEVALENLSANKIKNITTKQIDLDNFEAQKKYDLIVKCNYLDRTAIKKLSDALNKNGFMIIETYMHHPSNTKPDSNPDFLLQADELKTFFDEGFEVLEYDEFDNEPNELYRMRKQSIVVRKK